MENILKTITVVVAILGIIGLMATEYGFAYFVGACISGIVSRYLAEKKGYNKDWAFIYGWTWGIIAAIYYLVCDKKK